MMKRAAPRTAGRRASGAPPGPQHPAKPIVLVSGCDDRFALLLGTMLHSVIANLDDGQQLHIFILDDGISQTNKARIAQIIATPRVATDLTWLQPDLAQLQQLPVTAWHNRSSYMRLLIPELLDASIERVIYLDSDVVVERNLRDLWEHELGAALALGVENFSDPYVAAPAALPETYAALGLPPETVYCNTGVMVINLRRWRDEQISQQILDFTREHAQLIRFADQDGINAIVGGRWGLLDPRWNVQIQTYMCYKRHLPLSDAERREAQRRLLQEAFITHYTGRKKPSSYRYHRPGGAQFLRYVFSSGWFSWPAALAWTGSHRLSQLSLSQAQRLKHLLAGGLSRH